MTLRYGKGRITGWSLAGAGIGRLTDDDENEVLDEIEEDFTRLMRGHARRTGIVRSKIDLMLQNIVSTLFM